MRKTAYSDIRTERESDEHSEFENWYAPRTGLRLFVRGAGLHGRAGHGHAGPGQRRHRRDRQHAAAAHGADGAHADRRERHRDRAA
ncbi:conserved hypothetical protein [Ricinus communis]|uniref:Uncharacterized protein n=1 Tax=Ricinus communis TaxID=3988 RepID=B9TPU5_RICCO|nr:conserved hypothetical protein [Ricinus communis]